MPCINVIGQDWRRKSCRSMDAMPYRQDVWSCCGHSNVSPDPVVSPNNPTVGPSTTCCCALRAEPRVSIGKGRSRGRELSMKEEEEEKKAENKNKLSRPNAPYNGSFTRGPRALEG